MTKRTENKKERKKNQMGENDRKKNEPKLKNETSNGEKMNRN